MSTPLLSGPCATQFNRAEGAILTHLLSAVSQRPGMHSVLSRDLVALWADEYSPALALLKRIFPPGLIRFLNQRKQPPQQQLLQPQQQRKSRRPHRQHS